ncbi:MAG: adenylate/guanylate cyclase domain-containing protein [Treponema sp.]|nr:adenylate/guanylate cyclase domain-containing protein [Treponema sp.]
MKIFFKNTVARISGKIQDKTKYLALVSYFLLPVFLLVLFFAPVTVSPLDLYGTSESPVLAKIFAFKLPFDRNLNLEFGLARILLYFIYLLPAAAVYSIVINVLSVLKNKQNAKSQADFSFILMPLNYSLLPLPYILIPLLAAFSIYLFCDAVSVVSNANSWQWFSQVPFYIYFMGFFALFSHSYLAFRGILYLRSQNSEYLEYRKVRSEDSKRGRRFSIKTKFTFVITGVIIVILLSFMLLILNSYRKMFTEAVSDVGRAQAEHTAEIYDSADGRYDKIAEFFKEQGESNTFAETPFERIDIIVTYSKETLFLEDWDNSKNLPEFNIFAYTTGKPKEISEDEKTLTNDQAFEYLKRYKNGTYKKDYVFNPANKTCKYIYPVTFSQKGKHKLVGFSIVTYRQQVLMRQYFRTKIFVFTIITVFLYLTVIFSVLLSDFIFNPLLFLRKNVRKTSNSIEKILNGKAKNASNSLKFSETIKTNDEIKDLSLEIGDMVSLIKGIMPYVSFSTLQHAEKNGGEENSGKKSTTSRDLCFLFTDIRGFTSLCEGMAPKKVVEILNHYLDIETKIILENDGDIDKYVGDEMMAFFAGPRKEINACKAAMQIRQAMREEQERSMEAGLTYVSIGIGINSGEVIFGSVGASTRKDFTSIGDTVNLAARLESANKAYGSKSIITEAVFKKLRNLFICRELDFITVKGKTEPVRIYEILQEKSNARKSENEEKLLDIQSLFEKGLSFYREQNWDESEKYFSVCAMKYNDMPSIAFLDRIRHFKANPPPKDWDGVFKMSVK